MPYPGPELLQEVGRVTIAGSRLDVQMGLLWHHLDRAVDFEVSRRAAGTRQVKTIRQLAGERLEGQLRDAVLDAVQAADDAREHRNEIVHQDWVLRGRDGMRPVAEFAALPRGEREAYLEEWDREANESPDWQRVPARSTDVVPAQTVDELKLIERELVAATDAITHLTFVVASARDAGTPPGYVHPPTP